MTRTATQAPLDASGGAAEGGRGLAAFLVYLGTTRSPFAASTDAIWPSYPEGSSAAATHCQCEDVMSGDPPMRGGRRGAVDSRSDETVDERVISDRRSTAPSYRHFRNTETVGPGRAGTPEDAGEASERMTGEEGAR